MRGDVGGGITETARLTCGWTKCVTVAALFDPFRSSLLPVTVKTLVILPPMDAVTTTLKVTDASGAMFPRLQVTTPAEWEHAPCGVEAEMKLNVGGRMLRETAAASVGPWLVTVTE